MPLSHKLTTEQQSIKKEHKTNQLIGEQEILLAKIRRITEDFEDENDISPSGIIIPRHEQRTLIEKLPNNPLPILQTAYLSDEEVREYKTEIRHRMKFPVILTATKKRRIFQDERITTDYNLNTSLGNLCQI